MSDTDPLADALDWLTTTHDDSPSRRRLAIVRDHIATIEADRDAWHEAARIERDLHLSVRADRDRLQDRVDRLQDRVDRYAADYIGYSDPDGTDA